MSGLPDEPHPRPQSKPLGHGLHAYKLLENTNSEEVLTESELLTGTY